MKAQAIEANLKASSYQSQVEPLNNQIALLTSETKHLKEMNELLMKNEKDMRAKMNEALDELHENQEMFNGADFNLKKMVNELNKVKGELKTNTNLMHRHELDKEHFAEKLYFAE